MGSRHERLARVEPEELDARDPRRLHPEQERERRQEQHADPPDAPQAGDASVRIGVGRHKSISIPS